jgi:hypothetical protein
VETGRFFIDILRMVLLFGFLINIFFEKKWIKNLQKVRQKR